jgi:hypothetical protein
VNVLCNFTRLNDPFQLSHHQRTDPHCTTRIEKERGVRAWAKCEHNGFAPTLFANKTVVAIIRVVGISQAAMGVFKLEELVAVFA